MNAIAQMNTVQIETNDNVTEEPQAVAPHNCNLQPRPVSLSQQMNLLQTGKQSTHKAHTKPHEHVMMTHPKAHTKPHKQVMMTLMSVKSGIKKFGQSGSDALLKELHQLHSRDALLPVMKDNFSSSDRKGY